MNDNPDPELRRLLREWQVEPERRWQPERAGVGASTAGWWRRSIVVPAPVAALVVVALLCLASVEALRVIRMDHAGQAGRKAAPVTLESFEPVAAPKVRVIPVAHKEERDAR